MCGDWNVVQDQQLDTFGYLHENNSTKIIARRKVLEIMEEWELVDPWRTNNPTQRRFTWRTGGGNLKQARLDFFLISPDLYTRVDSSDIYPGYRTDQSLVTLSLLPISGIRGRGFWKLNTSLLLDQEYLELIRVHIKDVIQQYAQEGEDLNNKQVKLSIDDQLFFDTLKMELRGKTIEYGSRK